MTQDITSLIEKLEMTPSETLAKAAEFLSLPGRWGKGDYKKTSFFKKESCFCILGAVLEVQGKSFGSEDNDKACLALSKTLFPNEPWPFMVARWNDRNERTQTEVVLALKLAASQSAQSEAR